MELEPEKLALKTLLFLLVLDALLIVFPVYSILETGHFCSIKFKAGHSLNITISADFTKQKIRGKFVFKKRKWNTPKPLNEPHRTPKKINMIFS